MSVEIDWQTLWQRRMRGPLSDNIAARIEGEFGIRIRSFERTYDRLLGECTYWVEEELTFLALELDDFENPIFRLVGPASLKGAIEPLVAEIDYQVSKIESSGLRPPGPHGTPIWVASRALEMAAASGVIPGLTNTDRFITFPAAGSVDRIDAGNAILGILVDSLDDAITAARESGGLLLREYREDGLAQIAVGNLEILLCEINERISAVRAHVYIGSPHLPMYAHFFSQVAGWSTEVVQGEPLCVLLGQDGNRIGIIADDETDWSLIPIPSSSATRLIERDLVPTEYLVTREVMPLRDLAPLLTLTDRFQNKITLCREDALDAVGATIERNWAQLSPKALVAFSRLRSSFDSLRRSLHEILVEVPAPAPHVQKALLAEQMERSINPAAAGIRSLLGGADQPGQIIEAVMRERAAVGGAMEDLRMAISSLEDQDLANSYRDTKSLLVETGLLSQAAGGYETANVRV